MRAFTVLGSQWVAHGFILSEQQKREPYFQLAAEQAEAEDAERVQVLAKGFCIENCEDTKVVELANDWRIFQMCKGDVLHRKSNGLYIVYEFDTPEILTWQRYAVRQAQKNGVSGGEIVRCVQLIQEPLHPAISAGMPVTHDVLAGGVVALDIDVKIWLPLIGSWPEDISEITEARFALIGERPASDATDEFGQFFGLLPTTGAKPTGWLVLLDDPRYCGLRVESGTPRIIQYNAGEASNPDVCSIAVLLSVVGDDAVSFIADSNKYVLRPQGGDLIFENYYQWKAADVLSHPEYYSKHGQAALVHVPSDWIGARVYAHFCDSDKIRGELIAATATYILLRTEWADWSLHGKPTIIRLEPEWLSNIGASLRQRAPEDQIRHFAEVSAAHALFVPSVEPSDFVHPGSELERLVAPVVIAEVGTDPKSGAPILMYGGPSFEYASGLSCRAWYRTYEEAEAARARLIAALANPSSELLDACQSLPEFVKSFKPMVIR